MTRIALTCRRAVAVVAVLVALASLPMTAPGGDLRIENVQLIALLESGGETRVLLDLSWSNSWRNERNFDAAWVFLKTNGSGASRHLKVAPDGHRAFSVSGAANPPATIDATADGTGLFVYPKVNHRGKVSWRVSIRVEINESAVDLANTRVAAYGVEMVFIPSGAFFVGDPHPTAVHFGSFYAANEGGQPAEFFRIDSEELIEVRPTPGNLYYPKGEYLGDQMGPIPAAFPKGHKAFYIMKYELSQGLYADFLNTLAAADAAGRANFSDDLYEQKRGTIRLDGHYFAGSPERPLNFMHWDDGLAFADWACLRPLTEFEFTKAARGTDPPQSNAFPWGTSSRESLARIVGPSDDLIMTNGWDETRLSDETRTVFGASYYWTMDLAGSVWERVVTPSRADGRLFAGSHGDGQLGDSARATNADWPHGYLGKEGHGYRGGGFYDQGRPIHEFNPWSPVAYRRFGGWSGYDVHRAYGFRAARTAD